MVNVMVFVEVVVDGGERSVLELRALSVHTVALPASGGAGVVVAAVRVLGVVAVVGGLSVVAVPFEVFAVLCLAAQR